MTEDYGLSAAPVLIVDLDVVQILFAYINIIHLGLLSQQDFFLKLISIKTDQILMR